MTSVRSALQRVQVNVRRDGKEYQIAFEQGKTCEKLHEVGTSDHTGTTVTFKPDPEMFQETTVYRYETLLKRLREEAFLAQLKAEKKEGWACYLHTTKDVPDGMVSVDHKTGRIEHLFVAADARGKGIGQKMLDFARKKLEEHEHPTLTVLDQNTRAIALYRRMGWKLTGEAARVFDPAEDGFMQRRCELLVMRWEG